MRIVGVIKETDPRETRVAMTPETVKALGKYKNIQVLVERDAGLLAGFSDADYHEAGATLASRKETIEGSHYLLSINAADLLKHHSLTNKFIIGLFDPYFHKELIENANDQKLSLMALDLIPRISRAQSMDVLSSQANIAGYVAIILAASKIKKILPLMMTAAGTIKPAKILVLGAGVAGLQAIATAKRLGALVFGYDVRPEVKEQVESLGAKFVELKLSESVEEKSGYARALSEDAQQLQREKLAQFAKDMDVVITTAQIPGRKAPLLLDERVFSLMKKESVIIDMAAGSGGNVEGSVAHNWVNKNDVWLYGGDQLARMVPKDSSFTFSKNIESFLGFIFSQEKLSFDDEIIKNCMICHEGFFVNKSFADFIVRK